MIVGVDVSSRRIDLAWIQDGKPQRWHQDLAKGHLIDRLRSIRVQWPQTYHVMGVDMAPGASITDIAIEYPFGRGNAIAALMATVGVVTRQAPPWARVAWPSSGELRAAIGAANHKTDAHAVIRSDPTLGINQQGLYDWNEHELDALVACIGWQKILGDQ